MRAFRTLSAALAVLAAASASPALGAGPKWKKHDINARSAFEAAGVLDADGDGKLDILSGDTWYQAPDWKPHKVREVARVGTYYNCFGTLPMDVNADGHVDYITVSYFGKNIGWVENPGAIGKEWTYHEIDVPGPSEAAWAVDFNGDGKPELLPNPVNTAVIYTLEAAGPQPKFGKYDFGTAAAGHGIGSGDVNGDGRVDLLTPKGWFENPGNGSSADGTLPPVDRWTWHPDWNLGATGIQILARDIDGDGLSDLVYGMGHDYGLFWYRQVKGADGKSIWQKQPIDTSIASVHTLLWADLDGDGKDDELVTGKRVYAHEIEPGATDASVVASYRFDRSSKAWVKHVIFEGEPARADVPAKGAERDAQKDFRPGTAGTGLQMTAIDIDRDGDLDLVCPGKSGLYLFENLGNE